MPKFLFTNLLTPASMERVKDHGVDIGVRNVEAMAAHVGGKVEAIWYSVDERVRAYVLADLPSLEAAQAIVVAGSDAKVVESSRLVHLLTPEDMNKVAATQRDFPPPEGAPYD
jgi:hypothetical protein